MAEVRFPLGRMALIGCLLAAGVFIPIYFFSGDYDHVFSGSFDGPGTCRECHAEQVMSWQDTPMASTFDVLRPSVRAERKKMAGLDPAFDYTHDEDCLPCHTTGYGLMGGFVSIEETPEMAGITCESCHGPGGTYADSPLRRGDLDSAPAGTRDTGLLYPPSAEVCSLCHNENSPFIGLADEFDFIAEVKQGIHVYHRLK